MRRSVLFMPGNNAGMLLNADFLGADGIILDLEDAVSPAEKDAARILVRNAIRSLDYCNSEVIVRVNSLDTPYWKADLAAIVPLRPAMLLTPKINSAADVLAFDEAIAAVEQASGIPVGAVRLMPLIETALGLENAYAVASACKRVAAVLLGAEDLTADLNCKRTKGGNEIFYARGRIVSACRAAGVDCYDTPFTDVNDAEGIVADAAFARSLGFSGKAAISPRHVTAINEAFSPTEAEIRHAVEVLETIREAKAAGKGVVSLHGKMIDAPVVARAERVIADAKQLGVL